jgi:hypothetical protein
MAPVRSPIHLGSGDEGKARKAALLRLATQAGFPNNLSGWLVSLADAEIARTSIPEGVPAFSRRLSADWLQRLPEEITIWKIQGRGYVASPDQPEGGAWIGTAIDWLEELAP